MRALLLTLVIIAIFIFQATAQNRTVTGKVTDATGNPLSGATVIIRGKSTGTSTDENGVFNLTVPVSSKVITISAIGFARKDITLTTTDNITIPLTAQDQNLDEVVVVAYGSQSRRSITGSASSVNTSLLANAPRASVQESLQGNAPGVQAVNGSGQPGSVPNIRIRGIGSFNAGSQPLYVIDGVPLTNSGDITGYNTNVIAGLNSADIESFTVLKDAAASSLYGSRAGNGVILITTKSGRAGKTKFNATAQTGINQLTISSNEYPLNTNEMVELLREGWTNSGRTATLFNQELVTRAVDTTINTDWIDALTRLGKYHQYDISASGGNEKTTFYLSGGLYNSEAALKGVDYNRLTTKLSVTNKPTTKLSINSSLRLSYQKSNTVLGEGAFSNPIRSIYRLQPWLKIYNADGSYDFTYNNSANPVAVIDKNKRIGKTYSLLGTIGGTYNIYKGLNFETKAGLDINYAQTNRFNSPGFGDGLNNGGLGEQTADLYLNWVTTNLLKYRKAFGDHSIDVLAGYEAQKTVREGNVARASNFLPGTETLANASKPEAASSSVTANSIVSLLSNLNYNYNNKYFLSASFRRDGSSRFGSLKRYGNFWSVGGSWDVSSENFLDKVNAINALKLRASYGTNGNQDIGNFESRALYAVNGYENVPGYIFSQFGNSSLTWEENRPFNVGLDFGLFKSRISGTVEYYERTTSNLLLNVPVSATNGLTTYNDNIGEMKNKGWELSLNTVNISSNSNDGFSWETNFNFSTLDNKITKLVNPITSSPFKREVGSDYYRYFIQGYAGVDPQTGEALWYVDNTKNTTTNAFGNAARIYHGSALPDYYGGLTNTFNFKGITFSFQLYYNYGNKIYDGWGGFTNSDGSSGFSATGKINRYTYNRRWQQAGDITNVPKVVYLGSQTGLSNQTSSRFLYDGDYIRLRDISLSYNLPKRLLDTWKITNVRFYIRANNMYTYVKDERLTFDPEVPISGDLDQRPPIYKTLLFGVDISL